jgi:hypothetical protein
MPAELRGIKLSASELTDYIAKSIGNTSYPGRFYYSKISSDEEILNHNILTNLRWSDKLKNELFWTSLSS